ncbi:MAG: hemerythrin protein [Marmoricola sp.]|nr:hemerythrin protein [Marmoricola sp.]
MSMNKVIHGALRRDLDRFEVALAAFPAGDRERVAQLGAAWENFDHQLTDHHQGEHDIAWPALRQVGVSAETIARMDAEHAVIAGALAGARSAMSALQADPGADEAIAALAAIRRLEEVTVEHFDHEEQEIEPIYLANEDSPAIKEMGRRFAKVGPVKGGQFFAWVTDGASAEEKATIGATVPAPVLKLVMALFGRNYRKRVAPAWKG